jgi:hypothetical protein
MMSPWLFEMVMDGCIANAGNVIGVDLGLPAFYLSD